MSWACWAISTEPSTKIEEGLGSRDVRLGAVDERLSGALRVGAGCADITKVFQCQTVIGGCSCPGGGDNGDASGRCLAYHRIT